MLIILCTQGTFEVTRSTSFEVQKTLLILLSLQARDFKESPDENVLCKSPQC